MNKTTLLFALDGAPKKSKVVVTMLVDGKVVSKPVTSVFVVRDPQHTFEGEIRIQGDKRDDAYVAFVSRVGVTEGTVENFTRRYVGAWGTRDAFARNHFDNTYPLSDKIRPFINIQAYSEKIFAEDFMAIDHNGRVFIFKE